MKHTTLAYLGLLGVVFIGQYVSAQEGLPKATEVDPPKGDAEESIPEQPPVVDQENNIAESVVGGSSSSHGSGSIYGNYDSEECCWNGEPRAPRLSVQEWSQSEYVRRKIEYMLSKNPAVEQAISKKAMNCEKSHWGSEGLSDDCPSIYHRATQVRLWGNRCYIVRPHQQCVTYRQCFRKTSCANSAYGVGEKTRRSSLRDVPSRRIVSKGKDPCYGKSMDSSTCLPDGYRTFPVWIYCDFCGFRLINIELPQCCSCKRYNACSYY